MSGTGLAYHTMRCPVLALRITLCSVPSLSRAAMTDRVLRYTLSGTDLAHRTMLGAATGTGEEGRKRGRGGRNGRPRYQATRVLCDV
eukprot:28750-Rhodomonas_salina.1